MINHRGVIFRWRDFRDNKQKIMHLDGIEFLRRFSQHILPRGFVRIRHFGILSSTRKHALQQLQINPGVSLNQPISGDWKEICRNLLQKAPTGYLNLSLQAFSTSELKRTAYYLSVINLILLLNPHNSASAFPGFPRLQLDRLCNPPGGGQVIGS